MSGPFFSCNFKLPFVPDCYDCTYCLIVLVKMYVPFHRNKILFFFVCLLCNLCCCVVFCFLFSGNLIYTLAKKMRDCMNYSWRWGKCVVIP
jgi:hypothetical protein